MSFACDRGARGGRKKRRAYVRELCKMGGGLQVGLIKVYWENPPIAFQPGQVLDQENFSYLYRGGKVDLGKVYAPEEKSYALFEAWAETECDIIPVAIDEQNNYFVILEEPDHDNKIWRP